MIIEPVLLTTTLGYSRVLDAGWYVESSIIQDSCHPNGCVELVSVVGFLPADGGRYSINSQRMEPIS